MDDATASDNCGEVTIEVSSETTAGDAAGNYVIVRTFTATDDALETALGHQTITVQDTTAPEFTFVPADYTVECSDEMPMDDATASDNCGEVTIEVSARRPLAMLRATTSYGRSPPLTMLERRFGHADHHGRSPAPEFTFVPADYTVECSDEMPMDDATPPTCGTIHRLPAMPQGTPSRAPSLPPTMLETALRPCRPSRSRTPPRLSSPSSLPTTRLSAGRDAHGRRCASDNCGEVTIEVSSETTAGDAAGNYTIVRTFTATDDAGNSASATQTITVQDTTAPEFTFVPADYTVECSDMPMDDATAADNCGEVTIEVSSETTAGDAAGNYTITRTFTPPMTLKQRF